MPWKPIPGRKAERECKYCKKTFSYYISDPRIYCSMQCRKDEARRTTNCPECGKEFWYLRSWPRKYCSRLCSAKNNYGNLKEFAYPPAMFIATCETCGVQFESVPSESRGRFCSQKCFGKWQSENITGDKTPNWKGGGAEYYGPSWQAARRKARARDGVCQDCGKTPEQNGKALDVHHIVPFRLFGVERHIEANDLSNLVSLCMVCHTTRDHRWRAENKAA